MPTDPDTDRRHAVHEAVRAALAARRQEWGDRLRSRLREAVDDALDGLAAPLEIPADLLAPAATADDTLPALQAAIDHLAAGEDQVSILNRLVEHAARFADRAALFVARRESAVGWTASGFSAGDLRQLTLPLDGTSLLARAAAARAAVHMDDPAAAAPLWDALQADERPAAVALPLSVKDRVVALLFCDGREDSLQPEALGILARVAEISLGAVALRGRAGSRAQSAVERRPSRAWEPATVAREIAVTPPPAEPRAEQAAAGLTLDLPPGMPAAPVGSGAGGTDAHAEAQRFARLLVSEIVLYNEAQIAEGRKHRDLYARLREDLQRSEQMYRQRVPADLGSSTDYFQDEVVRTLAGGDPSLLGRR